MLRKVVNDVATWWVVRRRIQRAIVSCGIAYGTASLEVL